ncbi:MAG: ABC transporter ATP-binding protein [Tepidisphaerales bacterium]
MPVLELIDVSRVYQRGVRAVEELSLRVEDGELVVLAGPSGCGKSTTLRMIAGLDRPTSGEIRLGGSVIDHLPPDRRNVAMVFQNHALYPHLNVRGNLEFGLRVCGTPAGEIQRRVQAAAGMLGIAELLDRMPGELSGGQRQRVALGRAIVRQPEVLLLDEPLASLDGPLRIALRGELKRVQRTLGAPTLHVTHDQEEAMSLADRLVIMKGGRVQQVGRPGDVYARPANRFVAGFVGARGMNFLDGIVGERDGKVGWTEQMTDKNVCPTGRATDRNVCPTEHVTDKNVCPAAEDRDSGALTLTANGFTLCVPPHSGLPWQSWVGRHVVLGIRPEHLRTRPAAAEGFAGLRVRVDSVEALGSLVDVVAVTALGNRLIARLDAREEPVTGSDVVLYADMRDVCFFEPGETGMNLCLTNESSHAIA